MKPILKLTLFAAVLAFSAASFAQSVGHPKLILTKAGVQQIRGELGQLPLFDASVASIKAEVDAEIALGIDTPIPKDFSGGYTHKRHKQNFLIAQKAGVLYQILEDQRYAIYVRDMLFQYEAMYRDLPLHPQERSYARGKLFWQCLNESNWLVYMSQAYDAIYDFLEAEERDRLETNLFKPVADFISIENPQFYNRVHNHSTWGTAAVGLIALVMDDEELLQRALYGIEDDGLEIGAAKDNDGGFIKVAGQKAGFLANLEEPFSPDGYYTEGPYYQRYAMYPFLIFAAGLQNVRPDLKVLEYKDGVLLKSIDALLNLSDADGEFFPLNDGQKGMSYYSRELVTAVDLSYHLGGHDPQLLSIAEKQGEVLLDDAGFAVAMGVREGKAQTFAKRSVNLSDGSDGKQGGVALLRYGAEALTLVFKYSAQGLSHGHYDKLSYSLFEQGEEVIQDYGLVRFVNIQQKGGGNYLKENTTWAKQTIAHNTLTIDETSHFAGEYEIGSQHHSTLHFFDVSAAAVQVVSARETNAYPGVSMLRTMAMIKDAAFEKPFVLDLLKVTASEQHQYDLPIYYHGQVMQTNFDYEPARSLDALGAANGYQHLFREATGQAPAVENTKLLWMHKNKFYTLTTATQSNDALLFTRIGANDPEFSLRRDPGFTIRRKDAGDTVFASILEPHGSYSPVSEFAENSNSSVSRLEVIFDDDRYTGVSITDVDGNASVFIVANDNSAPGKRHRVRIAGQNFRWQGPYYFNRLD